MENLHLEVVSPIGILFKGNCHMAVVPASEGDMGIMQGHEMIISSLKNGEILILDQKENQIAKFEVNSGFAEMLDANNLLILID